MNKEITLNTSRTTNYIVNKEYVAITLDPVDYYSEKDLYEILKWGVDTFDKKGFTFNFVIESKKANSRNHIHGYYLKKYKTDFLKILRILFLRPQHHIQDVNNLNVWEDYIRKENSIIHVLPS